MASSLDRLKIPEAPAAFADFGDMHNALVKLIEGMKGMGGIKVVVSESRIQIEFDAKGFNPLSLGYREKDIILCEAGVNNPYTILVKAK